MSVTYDSRHRMPQKDLEYWVHEYASNSAFRESVNNAANGVGRAVGYIAGKATAIGRQAASRIKAAVGGSGNKRQRVEVKTEEAQDPQNHNKFGFSKRPPIGASTVFSGGEVIERPLSLSVGKPVQLDVLKAYLSDFLGSRRYKSQFAVQYVGDDQTRSCQGMLFRYRIYIPNPVLTNRVLKPTMSFLPPTMNGASGAGTQITGLPYNFFDVSYGSNMKCMVGSLGMGNIEDICASLTPPSAGSEYDTWSYNGRTVGSDVHLLTVPTFTKGSDPAPTSSWVTDYLTRVNASTIEPSRNSDVVVGVRQGGVKLFFENKHPVGSYVEVIQYKLKEGFQKAGEFAPTFWASGPDDVMFSLEQTIGKAYVDKVMKNKVPDSTTGRTPVYSDVSTNPYFPLLPKLSASNSQGTQFSERSRIRFAIASGAKRMVKVNFGGFKYNPTSNSAYAAGQLDNSEATLLVIAVNGQMISAFAQQGSDQLITGDAAAGHNMFIRGEYFEDLYPLKVTRPKTLFNFGEMQPNIPTIDTVGVTLSAYQILDARTQQRGNNVTMEAGAIIDNTDGDDVNDGIKV